MMSNDKECNAIAVFTSGGDAPGMNAVVRSVVRMALHYGRRVYAIQEGYQGLVDDMIKEFFWHDTHMIIHQGGTVIGSARCSQFRERPGRLTACENLVKRSITNLVCCGGDGSLTGANLFREEWSGLLQELVTTKRITSEQAGKCSYLNLVGCVGSIDNDMVYDSTLTIGADTALHRIVDAIDAVQSTASSHQRTFVLEIMGRHCGYLAWAAGVACGVDFIFIPESPPDRDDWAEVLCAKLDRRRRSGARLCTVLVAEGAIDKFGVPITVNQVRQVIVDRLSHDTRTTVLGHVQRGGQTSSYDRIMGSVCGAMAVEKLRRTKPGDPATIVGVKGFRPNFNPLMESVLATQQVAKYTNVLDFENAIRARGQKFKVKFQQHKAVNRDLAKCPKLQEKKTVAIMCSGAPAGAMNAAVRAACHYCLNFGYSVLAARGGFDGLMKGDVAPLTWMEVASWASEGGTNLQSDRSTPTDHEAINDSLKRFEIDALLVIGGFDALRGVYELRDKVPIPIVLIPATISNNVPGTDFSLGTDTAVNAITSAIDTLKKSADATAYRLFIVETQGRNCGFLAMASAFASGADFVYTQEEGCTLEMMKRDIERVKASISSKHPKRYFIVVRNEKCSDLYDLEFMRRLFSEEGKGYFTVRTVQMGHLCQGDYPSPLDRIRASNFAASASQFLINQIVAKKAEKYMIGLYNSDIKFTTVEEVGRNAVWDNRVPITRTWGWILTLQKHLARHGKTKFDNMYDEEVHLRCVDQHVLLSRKNSQDD